jgi:hypothetical protein|tara:strand:- start:453 stop:1376 length:924 start_codon:yes stop_codon:yes gene_type:complete
MELKKIVKKLEEKPSYLSNGAGTLAKRFNCSRELIYAAKELIRTSKSRTETKKDINNELYNEFLEFRKKKLTAAKVKRPTRFLPKPYEGDESNVLVIGDLHEPFCLEGYLEHCRKMQELFDCGTVVFIGDIIDNHYSSYHETFPDGFSAGEELERAVDRIQDWYNVFPNATVVIGNHDRMAFRKATSGGVSKLWVRDYVEVLNTPTWEFTEEVVIDNVCYNHGEGGTARTRMKNELQSQVQGHIHSQAYADYSVGPKHKVFGMQVGCGVDRKSYAMSYGKNFKKPVIACGVVINKGSLPIVLPMNLK